MRHFSFLAPAERDRLFLRPPDEFSADDDADRLGTALGATLYCPATRDGLASDIVRRSRAGVVSVVVCLEDAVADEDLDAAEQNAVAQLRSLAAYPDQLPLIFFRVRNVGQIPMLIEGLGRQVGLLSGFVLPKFGEDLGEAYFEEIVAASSLAGRRLLAMPVLEGPELAFAETRLGSLLAVRRLVDKYREHVPAVRIGATDLSAAYGLRRGREFTVWDIRVVADAISAVVNVFGRVAGGDYAVTGPVWEYFPSAERIFRPQLRMTPFGSDEERKLRTEIIAAALDGLIREVALDRANGLLGKTVIHPTHVAAVHALSVVSSEEYADACDVLATRAQGGASASIFGNKMNESKPHAAWARRTVQRAEAFGVAREGVSFVDLLGAGLNP